MARGHAWRHAKQTPHTGRHVETTSVSVVASPGVCCKHPSRSEVAMNNQSHDILLVESGFRERSERVRRQNTLHTHRWVLQLPHMLRYTCVSGMQLPAGGAIRSCAIAAGCPCTSRPSAPCVEPLAAPGTAGDDSRLRRFEQRGPRTGALLPRPRASVLREGLDRVLSTAVALMAVDQAWRARVNGSQRKHSVTTSRKPLNCRATVSM